MKLNKKVGLALEGGGGRGAYQIGAYKALKELGFKFEMVAGTSIGSLNSALIAQENDKLAEELWLKSDSEVIGLNKEIVKLTKDFKLTKENIKLSFEEIKNFINNKGLNIKKYKEMIDNFIDEEKIRKSKIKYGLVTIRLKDLKPLELTIDEIEEGKLTEYIVASSYLPIFKMDKIINDSYYLDGGFTNNLPITLLEKHGFHDIIAVRITKLIVKKPNNSETKVFTISPTKDIGSMIFFDNEDIQNNFKMGYYDTYLYFNKLIGYKYYFKKYIFTNFLLRKVNKKLIDLLKQKYKTNNTLEALIKSIEDILEDNNINYYEIYTLPKVLKYIKENNLKSNNPLINEFIYNI